MEVQCFQLILHFIPGGQHKNRKAAFLSYFFTKCKSTDSRKSQIQQDAHRTVGGHQLQGACAVIGQDHAVAVGNEGGGEKFPDALVVLHDEDLVSDIHDGSVPPLFGSQKDRVAPPEGLFRADIPPPWAATMDWQTDSPMPMFRLSSLAVPSCAA